MATYTGSASGGFILGGECTPSLNVSYVATGGLILSGQTENSNSNRSQQQRTLHPTYTFEVVGYDLSTINTLPLPDRNRENIILSLNSSTIWIPTIDESKRHGDQFTVEGQQAQYLKELYIDLRGRLDEFPKLKLVESD